MKKQEGYEFDFNEDNTKFRFISIGPAGAITKVVSYSIYGSMWNLAFGDAVERVEDFSDVSITNNGDMRQVIQTVVNTAYIFTDTYPDRKIYIEPVDKKRKLLYNRIFQEKAEEITASFKVDGILLMEGKMESYRPEKNYDAFVLTRIAAIFEE
jgi:hypothetical protein